MGHNISKIQSISCHECQLEIENEWNAEFFLCKGCNGDICKKCYYKPNRCNICRDYYCKFCRRVLVLKKCSNCKVFRCKDCIFSLTTCCQKRLSRLEEIIREHMLFQIKNNV
jgi:hypothetical protein